MFNFEKPTGGGAEEVKKKTLKEEEKERSAHILDKKAAEMFRKADEADNLGATIAGVENKLMKETNPQIRKTLEIQLKRLKEERGAMGKRELEEEAKKLREKFRPKRQEELKGDYSRTRLGGKRRVA